jgi:hypothetical protein
VYTRWTAEEVEERSWRVEVSRVTVVNGTEVKERSAAMPRFSSLIAGARSQGVAGSEQTMPRSVPVEKPRENAWVTTSLLPKGSPKEVVNPTSEEYPRKEWDTPS